MSKKIEKTVKLGVISISEMEGKITEIISRINDLQNIYEKDEYYNISIEYLENYGMEYENDSCFQLLGTRLETDKEQKERIEKEKTQKEIKKLKKHKKKSKN